MSALMWAYASILFKGLSGKVSPISINLGKGIIAFIFLWVAVILNGTGVVTGHTFLFLGLSGLLGITLGDTFYFMALMRLGPRLVLILSTLIPVVAVLGSILVFHEEMSLIRWMGVILTLAGVAWVLWLETPAGKHLESWRAGIKYGILSVACCSSAIIFSKIAVETTSALTATFIRQGWALAGLFLLGTIGFRLKSWLSPLVKVSNLKKLLFASFIGAFLGTWFCLLGLKYAYASIATTLNATSPIFVMPLTFLILKEKITFQAVMGCIIAVTGVALIFLG